MAYQHPLQYLLGLEGVALLRVFGGDFDREFAEARVAEIRRLLAEPALGAAGTDAPPVDTVDGYRVWSRTYDEPGNGLFPPEEAFVHGIVGTLPPGIAVDVACGTGRHTAYLASLGHRVTGVDSSPEMLALARAKVPQAEFHQADLHDLPLPGDHADLVTCALALAHLPDLKAPFAEFARILRPGGHLLVTDIHHELAALSAPVRVRSGDGEPGLIRTYRHRPTDYLRAALPLGLRVRAGEESRWADGGDEPGPMPDTIETGAWDHWPWSLLGITPAATAAAFGGTPTVMLWHFQKAD
ncbi:hypothetical protein GCM10010168_35230 [Actinoplanes ianthinogenes]|uniref:Methyltransferase type 11 domain-containing protein n=1 Tax=Actinoplanes ianthinogenes TaxID=122358 RepID=A0ABM7M5U1_9ACTN|nr:class I SAM-dependent methyltransferase [Actinoplanes ianthinogenes]BCJ46957.1 hypothetical protein Aiant_76140 [Actinoplanes ianthinogenes]GGR14371.1 hypothetical protein GCM10010168_35230 [Actinoplanes ianthinogenes]